jgi:predicted DNA-binding protein
MNDKKPKTKPIQTRLSVELIDRIDQQAADRGQSRSDRIADLIERGMETEILLQLTKDHHQVMDLLGIIHDELIDLAASAKG